MDGPRAILLSENNFIYALQESPRNRISSVGTETRQWIGQSRNGYSILGRDKSFPVCSYPPDWKRAYLATYIMGTGSSFQEGRTAGA